jgi:hypothetical protein
MFCRGAGDWGPTDVVAHPKWNGARQRLSPFRVQKLQLRGGPTEVVAPPEVADVACGEGGPTDVVAPSHSGKRPRHVPGRA